MTTVSFGTLKQPISPAHTLIDPLLLPFVQAPDEKRALAYLDRLIHQYADPIIAAATRRYTGTTAVNDGSDLRGEAIRILLARIAAIRDAGAAPIADFLAYVKVTARHLCWQHSRKARREKPFSSFGTGAVADAGEQNSVFEDVSEAISSNNSMGTCNLVMQRGMLRTVWEEACTLPKAQRMALLYNFRDKNGSNALPLLSLCNVVTQEELAQGLDVPATNLEDFLEQLPMEDSMLAKRLNVSSREVINLRVAARRRLTRRVKSWLEPAA